MLSVVKSCVSPCSPDRVRDPFPYAPTPSPSPTKTEAMNPWDSGIVVTASTDTTHYDSRRDTNTTNEPCRLGRSKPRTTKFQEESTLAKRSPPEKETPKLVLNLFRNRKSLKKKKNSAPRKLSDVKSHSCPQELSRGDNAYGCQGDLGRVQASLQRPTWSSWSSSPLTPPPGAPWGWGQGQTGSRMSADSGVQLNCDHEDNVS